MEKLDLERIEFNTEGLLPAIVQDSNTSVVLMLGYMNRQAIEKTLEDKKVTFFSRSKNRLWTKGETSGNFLSLVDMKLDCDLDTLLIRAIPEGAVCHTGSDTCWGEDNKPRSKSFPFLRKLEKKISKRLADKENPEKSYIRNLAKRGRHKIAQKVGEEAVELVIEAGKNDDGLFLEESADLLFHYLILLHERGFELKDVLRVLKSRNKK